MKEVKLKKILDEFEAEIIEDGKERGLSDEEIKTEILSHYELLQLRLKEKIDFENTLYED